jgi:hypothetical protein
MMRDDIHDALSRGDKEHASELLMVLRHFLATHPEAQRSHTSERVSFRQVNRVTGNRLRHQLVGSATGEAV